MNKVDPKKLGIPNICFSISDKSDRDYRNIFEEQRITRGFDDSETWSLTDTIAKFIIPRLERYEEIAKEKLNREDALVDDINLFLEAMKLVARDDGSQIWTKKEEKIVMKGLKKFPKIFMTLWW